MRKAMTLIELLVSSLILAIVIMGVVWCIMNYRNSLRLSVERKDAVALLQEQLELIQTYTTRDQIREDFLIYTKHNPLVENVMTTDGKISQTYKIYFTSSVANMGQPTHIIGGGKSSVLQVNALATWNNGKNWVNLATRAPR